MSEKQKKSDCPEERITHGDSPFGIVKDEEMLARFVLLSDKFSVDSSNFCILNGALPTQDILKRDGWSLLRKGHVNDMSEELDKFAKKRNRRGEDYGYALVKASDIREISDKIRQQAFCIIDDPQPENPAHALAQKAREYSRSEAQIIRDELLKKFTEVLTH